MATRTKKTRQRGTSTKPAAKRPPLSLVKETARPTLVDLRHPLPVRRRLFVGPMGAHEQAAIRAALAAASTRIPVPVRTWNGSTANLTDGTLLIHNPGPDRIFTAHIACQHGAIHGWPITSHTDLREARALTHACQRDHTTRDDTTGLNWDKAITHRAHPAPQPKKPAVLQLREGVRRAEATKTDTDQQPRVLADQLAHSDTGTADTQPIPRDAITAALATHAETLKEHPQP